MKRVYSEGEGDFYSTSYLQKNAGWKLSILACFGLKLHWISVVSDETYVCLLSVMK